MRKTIRREMIGNWELSLIEIPHPSDPTARVLDFRARMRLPGGFASEIGDCDHGPASEAEVWEAGQAFIAKQIAGG